ncbi:hypothetical protein ACFCV3_00880 [Kribbella sp. NPDC056345]
MYGDIKTCRTPLRKYGGEATYQALGRVYDLHDKTTASARTR